MLPRKLRAFAAKDASIVDLAEVRERPILFSAPMVRAILDGRKTQTRRIVRGNRATLTLVHRDPVEGRWWGEPGGWIKSPYGAPGDRLWVKETHASTRQEQAGTGAVRWLHPSGKKCGAIYRATAAQDEAPMLGFVGKWRPAIHMPRCLSRITLEVTGVRVERLQAISEDDARAEGVSWDCSAIGPRAKATVTFKILWDSINAKRAPWNSNPWVWVVAFRRVP
jgi:hypothetical protein